MIQRARESFGRELATLATTRPARPDSIGRADSTPAGFLRSQSFRSYDTGEIRRCDLVGPRSQGYDRPSLARAAAKSVSAAALTCAQPLPRAVPRSHLAGPPAAAKMRQPLQPNETPAIEFEGRERSRRPPRRDRPGERPPLARLRAPAYAS